MRFLFRIAFDAITLFVVYWIGYSHMGPTPEKILTHTTSAAVQTYVAAKPYFVVGKDIVGRTINKELENLGDTKNPFADKTE